MRSRAKQKDQVIYRSSDYYEPLMLQANMLLLNSKFPKSRIARISGVTATTIRNWQLKRTHRPQATTLKFALRAIGYKLIIAKE